MEDNEEERLRSVALQNAQSILLARQRAEEALRKESERLRVTLASIGDAVISTDVQGRVTFMNAKAEFLAGWSEADALGLPLPDVFRIINEETRQPVDNPVEKVLREGKLIELASHTVLIAQDGKECHIDASAAPMRDDKEQVVGVVLVFHDITRRKKAERATAHLAAIVESSEDAIISKTLSGIIMTWNKGAEKLFGYSVSEAVGQPVTMLIPPEYVDEEPKILEKIRRGETVDHYETVRRRKDGTHIDISLTVSPIREEGGNIIGASKIARDITDRKRAEEERTKILILAQEARKEAETANRTKDEFLATVSHELRTPLNAILGWARLLRAGRLDQAGVTRAYETLENNARAQAQLIEDLLDVSRIISGKLRLDVRPLDLATVIEAAIETTRPAADAKGIRVVKVLDPLPSPVTGDGDRLQQVVWNLLSNAIKFTPKGGRVLIRLERVNSHVEIIVSDTGIGIKPEFLPHVFDRFRQADGSITRLSGGLGLGLAIVRHLVELHGGTVSADSQPGEGATFTVQLPAIAIRAVEVSGIQERVHPTAGGDVALADATTLNGIRVLVVDDQQDTIELLTAVLSQSGAEVKSATSVAEALLTLQEWQPDVLVSDIGMPGEDGYELVRKMRALEPEQGKHIPAVALTAHARTADRLRALSAGFEMHVPKPVDPAEIVMVVASLARHKTGERLGF